MRRSIVTVAAAVATLTACTSDPSTIEAPSRLPSVLPSPTVSASPTTAGEVYSFGLSGAAAVPPGDPDGSGDASLRVDVTSGEVCFIVSVAEVAPITAMHIHEAAAGATGPVVVGPMEPPAEDGRVETCEVTDAVVLENIVNAPDRYYLNLHNAEHPEGALRGQLSG